MIDADHAGNGLVNGGLGAILGGLVVTAVSSSNANSGGFADTSSGVYVGLGFLAGGIALAVVGFSQYAASRGATGLPALGSTPECKQPVWYVNARGTARTAGAGRDAGAAGSAGTSGSSGAAGASGAGGAAGASGAMGVDAGQGGAGGQSDAGTPSDANAD